MKAAPLIAGSGLLVILTSHASFTNPVLIKKLDIHRHEIGRQAACPARLLAGEASGASHP